MTLTTPARSIPIRELEARYGGPDAVPSARVLEWLGTDPRPGARRLYARLRKRREAVVRERRRVRAMRRIEAGLWSAGIARVVGVDEVGVGPMAGPVVAAAVVFPPGTAIAGVDDSKRLDPERRQVLDVEIRGRAECVAIGMASVEEIDRMNVYHAALVAMRRAVEGLAFAPDHVLVDARTIPGISAPQEALTQGDTRSFSIAAASIVAKVYRDGLMSEMADRYPGYGFERHKGYCSPEHQEAVRTLGPCPIHRRSYDFVRELTGGYDVAFYRLQTSASSLRTSAEFEEWEARLELLAERIPHRATRKLRARALRHAVRMGWR
jgi:ribonuclease HII